MELADEIKLVKIETNLERAIAHQVKFENNLNQAILEFREEFSSIKNFLNTMDKKTIVKINEVDKRVSSHHYVGLTLLFVVVPLLSGILYYFSTKI